MWIPPSVIRKLYDGSRETPASETWEGPLASERKQQDVALVN